MKAFKTHSFRASNRNPIPQHFFGPVLVSLVSARAATPPDGWTTFYANPFCCIMQSMSSIDNSECCCFPHFLGHSIAEMENVQILQIYLCYFYLVVLIFWLYTCVVLAATCSPLHQGRLGLMVGFPSMWLEIYPVWMEFQPLDGNPSSGWKFH